MLYVLMKTTKSRESTDRIASLQTELRVYRWNRESTDGIASLQTNFKLSNLHIVDAYLTNFVDYSTSLQLGSDFYEEIFYVILLCLVIAIFTFH